MNKGLVLEFTKMHGAGNDFIVVDNRFFRFSDSELCEIAARFCQRRLGIGADGMLALNIAESSDVDYRMRYINADGSVGEMCGNGARCLASFARHGGIDSRPLHFETDSGLYRAYLDDENADIVRLVFPASTQINTHFARIEAAPGQNLDLAFMISGVPHAVWFGDDLADLPVDVWGPTVRRHACFEASEGTNVDFVQIIESGDEAIMRMRTYERGVEAETLACGTGAVSSLIAAYESGRIGHREATIQMAGGDVRVGYVDGTDEMFLEGPVAYVYRGSVVL